MQIGMVGLGRMGANMTRRLLGCGHEAVVFDVNPDRVAELTGEGASGSASPSSFAAALARPRAVWLMVPAAAVDDTIARLRPHLAAGDVVIDGGNSHYHDDIRRGRELGAAGIDYVDVGTSGGVWGLARGYCLMIGGEQDTVRRLDPIFSALAPGGGTIPRTTGRREPGTAEKGYLHCGPHGAGHFVKMVHNAIEYGLMAAYAEGFNVLRHAGIGLRAAHEADAETTPLRAGEHYQYELNLADVAEVWRHGSVITSWLLDLTAAALASDPALEAFAGRVSDSGEGRWTIQAAIDEAVPVPVLATALFERFSSRGEAEYANRLLSAMRQAFGGHIEKPR
jgi:6-phosphogluconate dehydrogenase